MSFLRQVYRCVVPLSMLTLTVCVSGVQSSREDVARVIADHLGQTQIRTGALAGSWPSEESFAGPPAVGMVCAYEWLGDEFYDLCAWRAGDHIRKISDLDGDVLGDEAYAFVRLSGVFTAGPPLDYRLSGGLASPDIWRAALENFYGSPRVPGYEGSTSAYLRYFNEMEPSTAVFYLAHHVVAVYYIDDQDKEVWRDAMIKHLSRVDDDSIFPVTALGVAAWALAEIDGLKADVPVASDVASPQWEGVMLADLPALLLSHQVPEGAAFAGSFYWRFDHTSGGLDGVTAAGYTEDTIYGVLGLVAVASRLEEGPVKKDVERAITAAREALLQGVDAKGTVYEHLSRQGETYYAFAGEMLQALWAVEQYMNPPSTPGAQQ